MCMAVVIDPEKESEDLQVSVRILMAVLRPRTLQAWTTHNVENAVVQKYA